MRASAEPKRQTPPWPSVQMLERMGLVRCPEDGCSTWVDPCNVPSKRCMRHQQRRKNKARFVPR